MKKCFFITGTDTHVGKTYVSCNLLMRMNQLQLRTLGIKPVASGTIQHKLNYYNEDALHLSQASSIKLPYDQINPFLFQAPVSPHLAAELEQRSFQACDVVSACQAALSTEFDFCLIEGAGGWLTPINGTETMADVATLFQCPLILVIGLRLGCLNHALLTYENIKQRGLPLEGWVANQLDADTPHPEHMISLLKKKIDAPIIT
ncbi:MAG: dethiobiotin synthase [Gammaproteobacteria bacterium]|nr:dethiobiotin synthase [Gammaproteobacteria bacterium]